MTESISGIQQFIEYKRSIEKERPTLSAEPNLITIDGLDGAGKSTIAQKLVEKLQERFGADKVILVDITNLRGGPKQERLRRIAEERNIAESHLDAFYAAGVNRAYEEVIIPALKEGKIVVADRSEADLLRYALEHGDDESILERKKYIQDGTITHRLWAGNRIFVEASPKDAWENLKNREYKSQYDPTSLEDMERGSGAQKKAEQYIESLPHTGDVNVVHEKVSRIASETERGEYLDALVRKLVSNLRFPEKMG